MKMKTFTLLSSLLLFFVVPMSHAENEVFTDDGEDLPSLVSAATADIYPFAIDDFQGFTSLLVLSNFLETASAYRVCGLKTGGTGFTCENFDIGPLGSAFIELPTIGINNGTGQIRIFPLIPSQNPFGGSVLLLFSTTGQGLGVISPETFPIANP